MLDALKDSSPGILRGLLTLQINTIISDSITGEPMPALPHALLDLLEEYREYLQDALGGARLMLGGGLAAAMLTGGGRDQRNDGRVTRASLKQGDESGIPAETVMQDATGRFDDEIRLTPAAFHALRSAAVVALNRLPAGSGGSAPVLRRIVETCDAMKAILRRPEAFDAWFGVHDQLNDRTGPTRAVFWKEASRIAAWDKVPPNDRLVVRHAWEMSTDRIVAQSVMQLRGDMVTRLDPAIHDTAQAMHRIGVDTALGHWHEMMRLVAQLTGSAVAALLRRS